MKCVACLDIIVADAAVAVAVADVDVVDDDVFVGVVVATDDVVIVVTVCIGKCR